MKIAIFNKTVSGKHQLYYSHFIKCPGLLTHVFEDSDHTVIIE